MRGEAGARACGVHWGTAFGTQRQEANKRRRQQRHVREAAAQEAAAAAAWEAPTWISSISPLLVSTLSSFTVVTRVKSPAVAARGACAAGERVGKGVQRRAAAAHGRATTAVPSYTPCTQLTTEEHRRGLESGGSLAAPLTEFREEEQRHEEAGGERDGPAGRRLVEKLRSLLPLPWGKACERI